MLIHALKLPAAGVAACLLLTVMSVTVTGSAQWLVHGPPAWARAWFMPALLAYGALSAVAALAALGRGLIRPISVPRDRRLSMSLPPTVRVSGRAHVVAALLLGVVVLAEALPHLGAGSGYWATGRPYHESDAVTADGSAYWLDGNPQSGDAYTSVMGVYVMSGRSATQSFGWVRPGRAAYPFLVSLVGRPLAPLISLSAVFAIVNLVLWWGAALAMYDMARAARGSWWVGLAAGALTATGLGFTVMAGTFMSYAPGYAAGALVLWLVWRLHALSPSARWTDTLLTGWLAGAASLLNSLAPYFLLAVALWGIGRAPFGRLLVWAAAVVSIPLAFGRLIGPSETTGLIVFTPSQVLGIVLPVAGVAILAALMRVGGHIAERIVCAAVLVVGAVVLVTLAGNPALREQLFDQLFAYLQLPEYLVGRAAVERIGRTLLWPPAVSTWLFGANVGAAFPPAVLTLAAFGVFGLSRERVDWALAAAVGGAAVAVTMNTLSSVNHPRLMYLAFPGVYLLAASGLANAYYATRLLVTAGNPLAPNRRAADVLAWAVVIVLLLGAFAPSNASLWGNDHFDREFHFLNV